MIESVDEDGDSVKEPAQSVLVQSSIESESLLKKDWWANKRYKN